MRKDANYRRLINVVKNAVYEDEVKVSVFTRIRGYVRNNKLTLVSLAGIFDISFVKIDPQVVTVHEMTGIGSGSATHIQHLANLGDIVVAEHRLELLVGKRRLP